MSFRNRSQSVKARVWRIGTLQRGDQDSGFAPGMKIEVMGAEQLAEFLRSESARYRKVIEAAGIKDTL